MIDPLFPPLHDTLVEVELKTIALGCVIVALACAVHPFASVTVTLYVPAGKPVKSSPVDPLLHTQLYAAVPPLTVKLIDPVEAPLHDTFVPTALAVKAFGCVIV